MMISHWLAEQPPLQTQSHAPSSLPLDCMVCACTPSHWGGMPHQREHVSKCSSFKKTSYKADHLYSLWLFWTCRCLVACVARTLESHTLHISDFKVAGSVRFSSAQTCQNIMSLTGEQRRLRGCQRWKRTYCELRSAACCHAVPYVDPLRLQIRGRQRGPRRWRRTVVNVNRPHTPADGGKGDWWLRPARPSIGAWCATPRPFRARGLICVWWRTVMEQAFRTITFLWMRNRTMQKYSITS